MLILIVISLVGLVWIVGDAIKNSWDNYRNESSYNQYETESSVQNTTDRIKNFEDCTIPPEEEKPNPYPPQQAMPPLFDLPP